MSSVYSIFHNVLILELELDHFFLKETTILVLTGKAVI